MTVGEVIALLVKYCSDEYSTLMSRGIYSIDVDEDSITVYTTDGNTENLIILVAGADMRGEMNG